MNANASGSYHLATRRLEELAQLLGVDVRALLEHDAGQRALVPLLVGHADHGGLGTVGCAISAFSSSTERDPLAAGLDQVLGAVGDLDVAVLVDRADVAGAQPAVVGTCSSPSGRCSSRAAIHGPRTWISPVASPSHGSSAAVVGSTMRTSTTGSGAPGAVARSRLRLVVGVALRGGRADGGRPGCVSVMPQACMIVQAVPLLVRLASATRGTAEPPQTIVAQARQVGVVLVGVAQHVDPDRRHAGGERDAARDSISSASGSACRTGRASPASAPASRRRVRRGPRRWRGTSARPAARGRVDGEPERVGDAARHRVQERRAVRVDDALRVAGRAARVAHRRRPSARRARASRTGARRRRAASS